MQNSYIKFIFIISHLLVSFVIDEVRDRCDRSSTWENEMRSVMTQRGVFYGSSSSHASYFNVTVVHFHFCLIPSLTEAGRTNPFGVTESEARRGSHQVSLSQFKQRADLIEQIIRAGEDNTPSDVEVECNRYGYEPFEEILLTTKKKRKK